MYDYILKRSNRRTLSLKIDNDLKVVVSAPIFLGKNKIDEFVLNHTKWIDKHIELMKKKKRVIEGLDAMKIAELKELAKRVIPSKVEYYSGLMGVKPTGIKITSAKKRFGSCSGKNSLCFSYLLMLYPDEAVDYVVVHELAHIKHHNHSAAFYKFVSKILPDYKKREAILKGV
ncbi:MAG: M48 family metallopeptidase [Acutalibacteraceae bacterium]|nr:M48 family metallopeptidase [Acutalibacteraceae bacterium]